MPPVRNHRGYAPLSVLILSRVLCRQTRMLYAAYIDQTKEVLVLL